MLLNDQCQWRNFLNLEVNENENIAYQNWRNTTKTVLRGKITAINDEPFETRKSRTNQPPN